jgi:hypothetical protein
MPKRFKAKLIGRGTNGAWTWVRVPFDVFETFGTRGQVRVAGTINGFPFRRALMPHGDGTHAMVLNKEIREGAGCKAGDMLTIVLDRDLAERTVTVPPELERAFRKAKDARAAYNAMSYSHRRQYAVWVSSAKKAETRVARAAKALEMIRKRA